MAALSTLQKIFPPPQYMTLPSVGVDISDNSLKYVQFVRRNSKDTNLALVHYGDLDIGAGVIERGNVHNLDALVTVLKEVKRLCRAEYVRVSLPEERAYLFEVELKRDTPFKEVRGLLEFRLEENVPLSPRDVYFDYNIFELGDDRMHVAVAVYAKEIINNYYAACRRADLIPLSFEIEAQAIARSAIGTGNLGTYLIIDFGKTRMGVGIVHKGLLMYTSTIDIGGLVLSAALRKQYGDIAESELTVLKNTRGIIDSEENSEMYTLLKPTMNLIVEELETRIHYWNSRDSDSSFRHIEKIIFCGGSSNLAGLPEYLEKMLKIPTERAQVWQNAFSLDHFVPPIVRRYSYGYATAIGLGLHDFIPRS